jgi:hypothetical protein
MLPEPGGSRLPPNKPPHTAVGLGGPEDDDAKTPKNWKIRKEAIGIVQNLHLIATQIRTKLDEPGSKKQYMELLEYCLLLLDEAMKLARG